MYKEKKVHYFYNLFIINYEKKTKIVSQCPKLERIHLESGSVEISFFSHLIECIPAASNLRDLRYKLAYLISKSSFLLIKSCLYFRLKWKKNSEVEGAHVVLLLEALLKCSSHFERLVLIHEAGENQSNSMVISTDFLLSFVSEMTHLVAICLVGFHFDSIQVDVLKKRFTEEVVPHRPAFWFYVGPKLPRGNDTTIPRIHYDEIVRPVEAFYAPPRF